MDKELRRWTLLLQDIADLLTNPTARTITPYVLQFKYYLFINYHSTSIIHRSDCDSNDTVNRKEGEETKEPMVVAWGDPLIGEIGDDITLWNEAVTLLKERALLPEFMKVFSGTSRAQAMYLVAGEYLLEKGEYRKALQLLSACDPRPSERIMQCCLRGGFADEYLSEVGMRMRMRMSLIKMREMGSHRLQIIYCAYPSCIALSY